jgi:predicted exporter
MKLLKYILLLLVGLVNLAGLGRLKFDVNIFNLLPTNSPMVEGLERYQRNFGASHELIVSVRGADAPSTTRAADALAEELQQANLTHRTIRRSPFQEDPGQLSELLAYIWFNQPPDAFREMTLKLQPDRLQTTLENTLARMSTSFQPMEIARLSHDPFALTDLPDHVSSPMANMQRDPFASSDGSFRIFFAAPPFEEEGFWTYRRWVAQVRLAIQQWKADYPDGNQIKVAITGTPVFVAETGSGLMRDMSTAFLGTLCMVAGLFWLVHRKWFPLIWLVALLILILAATIGVGSLFLGALNAVSLGFAAILLGLAADYGLILYQEHIDAPSRSAAGHRRAVAPSILWAAGTTAGAFFLIGRSSLPGLTQLGVLVGIGILIAAVAMLVFFLPPLVRKTATTERPYSTKAVTPPAWLLKPATLLTFTLLITISALVVLVFRQPMLDYGTDNLGPKVNPAKMALDEIQKEIGGFDDALWLIVSGADEGRVAAGLSRSADVLDDSVNQGLLTGYSLPTALWPQPEFQAANRAQAQQLNQRLTPARNAALEAGFTEQSLQLTDKMFTAWRQFSGVEGVVRPTQPAAQWVFRQFSGEEDGQLLVLGKLDVSAGATQTDLLNLADKIASETGGLLFGWSLLSESLMGVMQRDMKQVLIPMTLAMLLLLGFAFRSVGGVFLSLGTLIFGMLCLMSVMVLCNWSWNLMNVMALPLLFGAGVDYSIHIQFALKRFSGDTARVRRTVGRAVLLCGASTASGFGTLGLASNAGVASLGRVCAAGIMIISLTSVYLLPVWWGLLQRRKSVG